MTEGEAKAMLGALLILTVIWLVWLVFTARKYHRYRKECAEYVDKDSFMDWAMDNVSTLWLTLHGSMCIIFGIAALMLLGALVGKLF